MSQTEEENDKKTSRIKFWKKLKEYLLPHGFVPVAPKTEHTGYYVKFKKENTAVYVTRYDIHINKNGIRIAWCLDSKEHPPADDEWRRIFYKNLFKHKKEINRDFGGENSLSWDCSKKEKPSQLYKIKTPSQQCDRYNEAEWESIFESIKDLLVKLDKAMFRHLEEIEIEMPD